MPAKYDKDTKAKAVRLVVDHAEDYASEWEAIKTVSGRLSMTAETLRRWVRQAGVDCRRRAVDLEDERRGTVFATASRRRIRRTAWRSWSNLPRSAVCMPYTRLSGARL